MQNDIGRRVCELLKGPVNVFKHGSSSSAQFSTSTTNYSLPHRNALATVSEDSANIVEHYTLNSSKNSLTVSDKDAVVYSASFDKPLEHDMYIIVDMNGGSAIGKVAEAGAKDFSFTLELSSLDTGIMNVSLFSHGSEDNTLFTSNIQPLTVKPDITTNHISGLKFNTDTIFANVDSYSGLGLYVETENGQLHDAVLWSKDLTLTVNDESIATTDGNRWVRGVSQGMTNLTATYSGFTASVSVDVGPALSIDVYIEDTEPSSEDIDSSPDIHVIITAPLITTSSLPSGTAGLLYSTELQASGTAPITWTLVSEDTDGLTLSTSGNLSGTPSSAGNFTFTAAASNSAGQDTKIFTLTVQASQTPSSPEEPTPQITAPAFRTSALPEGTAGQYYTASLSASGTSPITFTLSEGNLPKGLSFTNGNLSGTPERSGTFSLTFSASNSAGTAQKTFTLRIKAASSGNIQ